MTNMFANAKKVETKKPAAKKNDKVEVAIPGIADLAAIDAVIKSLVALKGTVELEVKAHARDHFVEEGMKIGRRPVNFRGVEEGGSGSLELKKRSTASKLTDDEQILLNDHGISFETVVTTEEAFRIKPEYKDDQKLLEKVSKALAKIKELPEDFIELQEGVDKQVVTEQSLNEIFALKNKANVASLVGVVGTLACKPKLTKNDVAAAFVKVQELIADEDED